MGVGVVLGVNGIEGGAGSMGDRRRVCGNVSVGGL